jgi:predicted nucleic acid-binding protein
MRAHGAQLAAPAGGLAATLVLNMYDAAYVALAERLDVVLLTAGPRLARSPVVRWHVEGLT